MPAVGMSSAFAVFLQKFTENHVFTKNFMAAACIFFP
jgi:hypothetical protein